ncbi:hypothetical protein GQ55_6G267100 [Panicum hallii var. hallii]|uniref:Uncharacterized protein n=1 Tax=Panicum hallii var. hallii TaxID=1504633 RepID=A0A2T7DA03_9POAL|nr:hypothetical protein GQ55_6G267100 [Panicum hallii var. hallii]
MFHLATPQTHKVNSHKFSVIFYLIACHFYDKNLLVISCLFHVSGSGVLLICSEKQAFLCVKFFSVHCLCYIFFQEQKNMFLMNLFFFSVSKAKISEYSEKIDALAARLTAPMPENEKPVVEGREEEISDEKANAESPISLSSGLRRRSAAHAEVRPSYQDRREISEHLSNWMQKLRLTLRSTGSCKKI